MDDYISELKYLTHIIRRMSKKRLKFSVKDYDMTVEQSKLYNYTTFLTNAFHYYDCLLAQVMINLMIHNTFEIPGHEPYVDVFKSLDYLNDSLLRFKDTLNSLVSRIKEEEVDED